jgi:hypothetical protein
MTLSKQETIKTLEKRIWEAQLSADVSALDELISDNLLFTGLSGELETKAKDLDQHRSGKLKITKLLPLDLQIREIPGGAIASVKMDASAIIQGQEVPAILRYTRVWIQENDHWVVAGGHMSVVPTNCI